MTQSVYPIIRAFQTRDYTMRELAELFDRDVSSVSRTIGQLLEYDLIEVKGSIPRAEGKGRPTAVYRWKRTLLTRAHR